MFLKKDNMMKTYFNPFLP